MKKQLTYLFIAAVGVFSNSKTRQLVCLFIAFITLLLVTSCSTRRNNIVSRSFHNVTSHYNGWFNARERVKQGAKTLAESHEDKYDRILKVFRYADAQKARAVYPDMDEAIKKVSIVIQRHSIYKDGKEYCNWIDNSYFIMGQAQFFKHDFWAAIETFQYTSSSYPDGDARYDAVIWLAQTYLMLGKTTDAEFLLDYFRNDKSSPQRLKGLFHAVYADFHLQKSNLSQAAEHLEKAAILAKKRDDRIRYLFILGQIYQKLDSTEAAFAKYQKVIKMNPPYEMAFNARINRARAFDVTHADAHKIKDELLKMLKDEKNKEYLDQIYYALAGIAAKEGNEPQAIEYLTLSVSNSTSNQGQKALSYLELAEIYYKHPEYKIASAYYDSTIMNMDKEYPSYFSILSKKESLNRLVENLLIIEKQDSLLALANMTQAEREAKIDAIIKAEEEEKAKQKKLEEEMRDLEKEQEQQFQGQQNFQGQRQFQQGAGGNWYFYNMAAISFGVNEFLKKWGDRKLEDNWRRKNKESIAENIVQEEEVDMSDSLAREKAYLDSLNAANTSVRKQTYLKNIPSSAAEKMESDKNIIEAYYVIGLIYNEQLDNQQESAAAFETLLARYPDNKYKLQCYYYLYKVYTKMGNTAKADHYKNILLNGFPDSDYARIIKDPDYFRENRKKAEVLSVFYENTFKAYKNRQFADVIDRREQAEQMFPGNVYLPRFDYLKALSIGYTQPVENFEASLKEIIVKYPKDSIRFKAQEILDYIKRKSTPAGTDSAESQTEEVKYLYKPDTLHYVIAIFKAGAVDANKLKIKFSNYNNDYYSTAGLTVSDALMGMEMQYILVKTFLGAAEAFEYYSGVLQSETVLSGLRPQDVLMFAISPDNLARLYKDKNTDSYYDFFQANYAE